MPSTSRIETVEPSAFYFVRHGATEPNLRKLRCGGDLDVALTELGRSQARDTAHRIQDMNIDIGTIVCSALSRARDTAAIIGEILGVESIAVEPLFNERRLGEWNLQPIADTEDLLARNVPPPGGESEQAFVARMGSALERMPQFLPFNPLLVSSKGVARVLNLLLGDGRRLQVANGEIVRFTMQPSVSPTALERIAI